MAGAGDDLVPAVVVGVSDTGIDFTHTDLKSSIVDVQDLEGSGPGGAVRFVRRELGVEAFGINWFELGPDAVGREHDESETGQEEVNVIVRGSGVYRVEGVDVPVSVGTFLRFDPGTTRVPIAGPEGMTMIGIGARRGSYEQRGPF